MNQKSGREIGEAGRVCGVRDLRQRVANRTRRPLARARDDDDDDDLVALRARPYLQNLTHHFASAKIKYIARPACWPAYTTRDSFSKAILFKMQFFD